jgi:hypothetical protein
LRDGAKAEYSSEKGIYFETPSQALDGVISVEGQNVTTTTISSESYQIGKGETIETKDGTKITLSDITYTGESVCNVTGSSEESSSQEEQTSEEESYPIVCSVEGVSETGEVQTYKEKVNARPRIVYDSSNPAGDLIVVGGPMANSVAATIADVSGALTKPGDFVVNKYGNKIVVAGYTAEDTISAANELIKAIESL